MLERIPGIHTDLVELRLDYCSELESFNPENLLKYRGRLILTIRDPSEGGRKQVDMKVKELLLRSAVDQGFLVDLEISSIGHVSLNYGDQILSRHYMDKNPSYEELESLVAMYGGKCRYLKIALRRTETSYRHLISLLNRHHNLVVMETDGDPASRIVYSLLGSSLLYCHLGEKTSPGQISCSDATKILGFIGKIG